MKGEITLVFNPETNENDILHVNAKINIKDDHDVVILIEKITYYTNLAKKQKTPNGTTEKATPETR